MNTCWFVTKAAIVKSLQTNDLQKLKIMKPSEKSTAVKKNKGKGTNGRKEKNSKKL